MSTRYSSLGLIRNPFPSSPEETRTRIESWDDIRNSAENFCVQSRQQEYSMLHEKIVDGVIRGDLKHNLWINGEIGMGKSALLAYFANELRKEYPDVPIMYVKTPKEGVSYREIYGRALQWMLPPEVCTEVFSEIFSLFLDYIVNSGKTAALAKKVDQADSIKQLFTQKSKEVSSLMRRRVHDIDEIKRSDISIGRFKNEFRAWLESEIGISRGAASKFGNYYFESDEVLRSKLLGSRGRAEMGGNLVSAIKSLDYAGRWRKYGILLLDELDIWWRGLTRPKREDFERGIASLGESIGDKIVIIGVAHPDMLDTTSRDYIGEFRHILDVLPIEKPYIINVKELDYKATELMVDFYLEKARVEDKRDIFLHPFTERAIEKITDSVGGATRYILTKCHATIENAAANGISTIEAGNVV